MFYWILEYGKVLAVYLFMMYLWPSVVFRNYLREKSLGFRFAFCSTAMVLLFNTTVLMIGVVKLLNPWIIRILFYSPLIYLFAKWVYSHRAKAIHIKYLLTDIYSLKRFVGDIFRQIGTSVKNSWNRLLDMIRPDLLLCGILALAVIYGTVYFSYGAFSELYYGASDVYVHHSWIDMLLEGQIFGAGVYPEGMHCFVYAMHVLFGVEVYSCLLFLGGIHISAFLVAVYLFLREIFPWKYSSVFALILFLIMQLDSSPQIGAMARLQWTIPQEFAMFAVFLCCAYLLRFLRNATGTKMQWKKWELLRDENLLIFLMALAVTITVHFYGTIMAFFLCLAIGLFFLVRVFVKKQVVPLLLAILCGLVIAVTPMLLARASGIEFQASIDWAMSIMEESQINREEEQEPGSVLISDGTHWILEDAELIENEGWIEVQNPDKKPEKTLLQKFYENSFVIQYQETKAPLMAGVVILGILLGIGVCIPKLIRRKENADAEPGCGYLYLAACEIMYMILFAAPKIGLVEIIQVARLGAMTHLLTLSMVMIPLDLIMRHVEKRKSRAWMDVCAALLCVGMCAAVVLTGQYHSYLIYVSTRYPAAAQITDQIVRNMEPNTYTVVSPVEELYHVKGTGFHEETVKFVRDIYSENYTLPSEYVFVYLEKQPLVFAHDHLLEGPAWLAGEEYLPVMPANTASQAPDILHVEISDELANRDISIPLIYESYKDPTYRAIIHSRVNQWIEKFRELYPYQLVTVYEDEAFACYMFQQNPARLLELAILER